MHNCWPAKRLRLKDERKSLSVINILVTSCIVADLSFHILRSGPISEANDT